MSVIVPCSPLTVDDGLHDCIAAERCADGAREIIEDREFLHGALKALVFALKREKGMITRF
ncbi:MAG TPA: hypothetical protein VIL97_11325 [Thermoanaerobaculia bacterium]